MLLITGATPYFLKPKTCFPSRNAKSLSNMIQNHPPKEVNKLGRCMCCSGNQGTNAIIFLLYIYIKNSIEYELV